MSLAHVTTSNDPLHLTACPFVLPNTPVPQIAAPTAAVAPGGAQ
jgi:hypothetical protein